MRRHSPGRVVPGQPQHQPPHLGHDRWAAAPARRVPPPARDQVTVPTQQRGRRDEKRHPAAAAATATTRPTPPDRRAQDLGDSPAAAAPRPVGSDRGAVPAFLLVRFPGPPTAPDKHVSAHPALHEFPLAKRFRHFACWSMVWGCWSPSSGSARSAPAGRETTPPCPQPAGVLACRSGTVGTSASR